ncbi:NlpC/P60 family protein [Nibribacter ruber]|uniref:NlpC/P60 family protein n=1 Tax=Nibribacter ruber TaxID=2698458 RepID=A0A6P1P4M5_9BACT|nr:NlpC/P60 family protein [Nibribacter ruber]
MAASCGKSSYSTFSKPEETYRSAQEIAELKKAERQQRRMAKKSGFFSKTKKKEGLVKIKTKPARNSRSSKDAVYSSKKVATVISTARSYRGTPYKFGGTTRVGMDCSGLLCTSFQAIDVKLPRTSSEQSRYGPTVSTRELRAGDLVFFSSTQSPSNITHAGIITEVVNDNEIYFIHSSTSLGVKEDNLFAPYYKKNFIKAVRPGI